MAKIGSMELIVILIVALFAIGPERLPKAAKTLGRTVGAFKKYMNEATSDLREASDEFKEVTDEIANAQKTMRQAFSDADEEIRQTTREAEEKLAVKKKKAKAGAGQADSPREAGDTQDAPSPLEPGEGAPQTAGSIEADVPAGAQEDAQQDAAAV